MIQECSNEKCPGIIHIVDGAGGEVSLIPVSSQAVGAVESLVKMFGLDETRVAQVAFSALSMVFTGTPVVMLDSDDRRALAASLLEGLE